MHSIVRLTELVVTPAADGATGHEGTCMVAGRVNLDSYLFWVDVVGARYQTAEE